MGSQVLMFDFSGILQVGFQTIGSLAMVVIFITQKSTKHYPLGHLLLPPEHYSCILISVLLEFTD